MSIVLPLEVRRWPRVRVLHKERWGGKQTSGGGWAPIPMRTAQRHGLEVLEWSRDALPALGMAALQFQYGRFADQSMAGAGAATAARIRQGSQWDPDSMLAAAPDLADHEIRIQVAPGAKTLAELTEGAAPPWRTVWWGKVVEQIDEDWGGADIPSGTRTYQCLDGLARTRDWRMNRHGFYVDGSSAINCVGHPGFNTSRWDGILLGNRITNAATTYTAEGGASVIFHTFPGIGASWTDLQATEQPLAASRPTDEPLFTVNDTVSLMGEATAWPVSDGETVLSFLTRILDRSRGLGMAFCDWADDIASPDGPLTCRLTICSQLDTGISYLTPRTGVTKTIPSAPAERLIEIDMIGDHRVRTFQLSSQNLHRYDYLESEGEQIEQMVTLGKIDSTLDKNWDTDEASTFKDLDRDKRLAVRYRPIYQAQRIPRDFTWSLGDGNGGTRSRQDYRCDDQGQLQIGSGATDSSMLVTKILDDLPMYEGYVYDSDLEFPQRSDGKTETGHPQRRGILAFIRTEDDRYRLPEELGSTLHVQLGPDGLMIYDPTDESSGLRTFGDPEQTSLGSITKWDTIVITVALQLGHRVRLATGAPAGKRRRRLGIRHQDLHLWIASPGAIWDLDAENRDDDGSPPKRDALGLVQGIIRDDRAELARRHFLAVCWYTVHETSVEGEKDENNQPVGRRAMTYSFADCVFLGSFEDATRGSHNYPKMGDIITVAKAGGQAHRPRTPVTREHYDHRTGVSTISTSWIDLDFARG